jgi:hypothetical protein
VGGLIVQLVASETKGLERAAEFQPVGSRVVEELCVARIASELPSS